VFATLGTDRIGTQIRCVFLFL